MERGEPWTDKDFPPEMQSLANENDEEEQRERMKDYSWKRLSNIYQDCKVFSTGITPNDIKQGGLGNCYYLSVLSAMAEFPERIEACFHTKEPNSAGIYLMFLYVNGAVTPVIVDDYVPV
ncbi:MAG: C2 family cysteine protease [Flammeovirgaceae bacterium]